MIEVQHLVKRYGSHLAVDDLSFTIEKGQIVGFLGPNGAGKSTTMNIITGYIAATEGTVKVNGYDVVEEPEKAKGSIGYLPEIPPLYPDMTVWEYLEFVADLKKVDKKQKEDLLEEICAKAQIEDVLDRLIKHLSKGYRQRVGLAGAMVGDPDILILDEPTVGLDPKQILEIRELIRELSKEHTIVLSSHIMQEVSAVCDHLLILNEGRLIAAGTPDEIAGKTEQYEQVQMLIKSDVESLQQLLEKMEFIHHFQIEKQGDHAFVRTYAKEDAREELFFFMAENKKPILEMTGKKPSLEEAFITLTESGEKEGTNLAGSL